MEEIHQVLVKLLDGKHKALNFPTPSISVESLRHRIHQLTSIPAHNQLLLLPDGHRLLHDQQTLTFNSDGCRRGFPITVHLLLRLRGGKGGFGSLLRGAATKAGQKKTSNFDACRDMSGRRLRHVNAEKKLEEWRAEAEDRKLEKIAENFIKKQAKEAKKKSGSAGDADKYVAKYREDSAKCMEEVERTVRESMKGFVSSKRKVGYTNGSDAKRLKIWLGKRKMANSDSDSDDMDEDDSDDNEEEENEKSVVIDNGNNSDSGKETDGSSGSTTGGKMDGESSPKSSPDSCSEEETEIDVKGSLETSETLINGPTGRDGDALNQSLVDNSTEVKVQNKRLFAEVVLETQSLEPDVQNLNKTETANVQEAVKHLPSVSSSGDVEGSDPETKDNSDLKPAIHEEAIPMGISNSDLGKPLNFDDFNSAAEMEALGMERLKLELQALGIKCGGTLQERAARLFLLKTMPLQMLPKKFLAKK